MLKQLLVLSPLGPCFIYRSYKKSIDEIDPQLISAIVAAETSKGVRLSEITKILRFENSDDKDLNIEVSNTHNFITCAISSGTYDRKKLRDVLPKINQLSYEMLGNPKNLFSLDHEKIDIMENRIDILMMKEGFVNSSV